MSLHVFADESKASGFRLAAVPVAPAELSRLRAEVGALKLPNQRRLHFAHENNSRRKQIIKSFAAAGVRAVIYDAGRHSNEKMARDMVIGQLADDVAAMGAARLVLELDDSAAASDRVIIRGRLLKAGAHDSVRYEHRRAFEECLLALPDAVVWCWAKGKQWRRLVEPLVTEVIRL